MSVLPSTLHALIGSKPNDRSLKDFVNSKEPESIKAYSDIVYYNYTSSGLSLQFTPPSGYKPPRSTTKKSDLDEKKLSLSTIDIYTAKYDGFPISISYLPPTDLNAASSEPPSSSSTMDLTTSMTGAELVKTLGEPDRKGGGESRSVGVWLEWTGLGLMCEFSSIHGTGSWDKEHGAGSAKVGIWSFFEPAMSLLPYKLRSSPEHGSPPLDSITVARVTAGLICEMQALHTLPNDILLLITEALQYDIDAHVHLSQVCQSLRAFYLEPFNEERWRRILAYNSLGKCKKDGDKTFREVASATVCHRQRCTVCRTVSEDIRYQYFRDYNPQNLLVPMTKEAVSASGDLKLRAIEGLVYNPSRSNKFTSPVPGHANALVTLFDHPIKAEGIRLSTSAMIMLDETKYYDLPATWEKSLQAGAEAETQQMMRSQLRLDRHIFLSSLFATTRPVQEVEIYNHFLDTHGRRSEDGCDLPDEDSVYNPDGITVLDVLMEMVS